MKKSLFYKLITGFLIVIATLSLYNLVQFSLYKNSASREIIKQNQLNLEKATRDYEQQFLLLKSEMLRLLLDYKVVQFTSAQRTGQKFELAKKLHEELKYMNANPMLLVHNIVLYFKDEPLIIEWSGTTSPATMFSKFMQSELYPPSFWQDQFESAHSFTLLADAPFTRSHFGQNLSLGDAIPVIIKYPYRPNVMMIAFVNSRDSFRQFAQLSSESPFFILNSEGEALYASHPDQMKDIPHFPDKQGYTKVNNDYYIYHTGEVTELVYAYKVFNQSLAAQSRQQTLTLITIMMVSIATALLASLWFSHRINHPLQQLIQGFQTDSVDNGTFSSRIAEFDWLGSEMIKARQSSQQADQHLARQTTQLKYYSYLNKLKRIRTRIQDDADPHSASLPYVMILFSLNPIKRQSPSGLEEWTYFSQAFIEQILSQTFINAVTLQIESDQVVSLIFSDTEWEQLDPTLQYFKKVFDEDRENGFYTIVVSPVQDAGTEFAEVYNELSGGLYMRQLNDETQIVSPSTPQPSNWHLLNDIVRSIDTHWAPAQIDELAQITIKHLHRLHKKGTVSGTFALHAEDLTRYIIKKLHSIPLHIDLEITELAPGRFSDIFHSIDDYEHYFTAIYALIQERWNAEEKKSDYIIDYVTDYVHKHYAKDLPLDLLSGPLNITSSYLSTYFKKQTGMKLVDYINRVRVENAKQLLCQSNAKVQQVAEQVGCHNINTFIRIFKKSTGVTPGEYQKRQLASNPPQ
ncbi:helix-turn-helix domain-containing protein [Paenibacillus sp. 1P07SE]|uniref:helix-turn-helix transcriptional regulator n=1 Tax=Paenibacillus sp. 1P07SE TaxID=3132209 RepID=UPI0039A561E8